MSCYRYDTHGCILVEFQSHHHQTHIPSNCGWRWVLLITENTTKTNNLVFLNLMREAVSHLFIHLYICADTHYWFFQCCTCSSPLLWVYWQPLCSSFSCMPVTSVVGWKFFTWIKGWSSYCVDIKAPRPLKKKRY